MSRTMTLVQSAFFDGLGEYCDARGEPIASPGVRYIEGTDETDDDLQRLIIKQRVQFGRRRGLVHLAKDDEHYLATVGFEFPEENATVEPLELSSGFFAVLVTDLKIQPTASAVSVRNVVEVAALGDSGYEGHSLDALADLFPVMRLFRSREVIDAESVSQYLLSQCIAESEGGGSWIDSDFAQELRAIGTSGIQLLPYDALSRATFDLDPRSMFMALYRCLEATYAFESCRQLVSSLVIDKSWRELAIALDKELSWRPRESDSLETILKYASEDDLLDICRALKHNLGDSPARSAGKAIYTLRNRIVHFNASMESVSIESVEWNAVCAALSRIVLAVFGTAFMASEA